MKFVRRLLRIVPRVRSPGSILSLIFASLAVTLLLVTFKQQLSSETGQEVVEDHSECVPCAKATYGYGNSSPDDLIIAGVFGGERKVSKFLRTLRSVGSRASVVFVTNVTVAADVVSEFRQCGAEFFTMKSSPATDHFYPHSLRYVGYKQFFDSVPNRKYKRVFHADSYDVFFQSDPFTEEITPLNLYFVMEDVKIGDSDWNSGWLIRAYNESVSKEMGEYVVSCSGTVIGGYDQFMIYLNTLTGHRPFWMNGRHSLDQAYHNYLLHTGVFARNGIKEKRFGCNSHVLTMHYCSRGKGVVNNGRVVGPDTETVPAVVHQFNLYAVAKSVMNDMCHVDKNKR